MKRRIVYLRIPDRRASLGKGKSTPDIEVTLSKKRNSSSYILRASAVKLSMIRFFTLGTISYKAFCQNIPISPSIILKLTTLP